MGNAITESTSPWRDRKGIAAHLGVSVRHITNLQRRRVIPYVKVGRVVRFDIHACDQALKAMEIKSVACLVNRN
jgi:excisionase family DNA binding protein